MKTCRDCNKEKPYSEFNKNKAKNDGYGDKCRECMKIYRKQHYKKNKAKVIGSITERKMLIREWYIEYKSKLSCNRCGENHPATLEFHHTNPKEKDIAISQVATNGWSKERIEKEIDKCEVLCSNCHKKEHYLIGVTVAR